MKEPEHLAFNLHHFAEDIHLSGKKRLADRGGVTFKSLDAAGQMDVPARQGLILAASRSVTPLDRCAASPFTLCLAIRHAKNKQNGAD
jgi:hypothetical protein